MKAMNIILKGNQKEKTEIYTLAMLMSQLECRIKLDTTKGEIEISDMESKNAELIIKAVNDVFNITGMEILPTEKENVAVSSDNHKSFKIESCDITQNNSDVCQEDVTDIRNEELEVRENSIDKPENAAIQHENTTVDVKITQTEPVSSCNRIVQNNSQIQVEINRLIRVCEQAAKNTSTDTEDLVRFIKNARREIVMKYNPKDSTEYRVGEIVDCYYGNHLKGELSGGHVHSIILNINHDGTLYVVPITKWKKEGMPDEFLPFSANIDVKYNKPEYTGGSIILRAGRPINRERIQSIVGTAYPWFIEKVMASVSTALDFYAEYIPESSEEENLFKGSTKISEKQDKDCIIDETASINIENEDEVNDTELNEKEINEAESEQNKATEKEVEASAGVDNAIRENVKIVKIPVEEYLSKRFEKVLDDVTSASGSDVLKFLQGIGFPSRDILIIESFSVACEVKKIKYDNILAQMTHTKDLDENTIRSKLKGYFIEWIQNYQDIKEMYPKISIINLYKIFAKKCNSK